MAKICVIGGICVDICCLPNESIIERDSNPSKISVSAGGVGFNIARRLAALGHDVDMICAPGCDGIRSVLVDSAEKSGVSLKNAILDRGKTGIYICVNDRDNDMLIGLSDLDCTEEELTPEFIEEKLNFIRSCDAVVVDGNLSAKTLEFITKNVELPIFADPVSTKKAMRFLPVLKRISVFKPNVYEAMAMTGKGDALSAAEELVRLGCGSVFVSCGADGIYYADKNGSGFSPAVRTEVANTTGAGDAAATMLVHTMLTDDRDSAYAASMANKFAANAITIRN